MDTLLAEAFLDRPRTRVLGRSLGAFTLWHAFLLEALAVPGMPGVPPASLPELAEAVRICTLAPLQWRPPTWRDRLWLWWLRWQRRAGYLEEQLQAWHAWVADHTACPEFFDTEDGVPVKTPWQLYRVAQLMRSLHVGHAEAWGMSPGRAAWLTTASDEAGGAKLELVTEELREVMSAAGYGGGA
jgi:hypothetical protein